MRDGAARGTQLAMAKPLTSRERDVLVLLANGSPISAIADAFDITERTARAHIQMVVQKPGVRGSAQAIAVALREGLIPSLEKGA